MLNKGLARCLDVSMQLTKQRELGTEYGPLVHVHQIVNNDEAARLCPCSVHAMYHGGVMCFVPHAHGCGISRFFVPCVVL